MTCISVVVPTAARPDMLEVTLRSVARQTAMSEISEVIVAENLGDPRSAAVCERFPELPIEYVLREPQLTPMENARDLLLAARSEFVAFVCDDDLWFPGHLENALTALRRSPAAAAHFSAFVGAESELDDGGFFWGAPLLWLAAGRPPALNVYHFSLAHTLALSWVLTPFQWSTVVARTAAAHVAAPALTESPHPFYADRMLCIALARQGEILFDPAIDTLYRVHHGNWQQSQDPAHLQRLLRAVEDEVLSEAQRLGLDLPAMWRRYLTDLPEGIEAHVRRSMMDRFSPSDIAKNGLLAPSPAPPRPPVLRRIGGRVGRAWQALLGRPN